MTSSMPERRLNSSQDVHRQTGSDAMARGLGIASLALGAMEIVGASALARLMGMRGQENFIRLCGAREIAQGVAILTARDPTPWVWARVAGDVLDIGTLVAEDFAADPGHRRSRMVALGAVLGITALDLMNARQLTRENTEPWSPPIDFSKRSGLPGRELPAHNGRARMSDGAFDAQARFGGAAAQPAEAM